MGSQFLFKEVSTDQELFFCSYYLNTHGVTLLHVQEDTSQFGVAVTTLDLHSGSMWFEPQSSYQLS
jgi:hypothetical protein